MSGRESTEEPYTRLVELLSRSTTRTQIVRLLLEGKSRKQIASAMQRSQHTIDSHFKAIYRALGVGDRGRLMILASRLPPPPPGNGD